MAFRHRESISWSFLNRSEMSYCFRPGSTEVRSPVTHSVSVTGYSLLFSFKSDPTLIFLTIVVVHKRERKNLQRGRGHQTYMSGTKLGGLILAIALAFASKAMSL